MFQGSARLAGRAGQPASQGWFPAIRFYVCLLLLTPLLAGVQTLVSRQTSTEAGARVQIEERYVDRIVYVPGPERTVYVTVPTPGLQPAEGEAVSAAQPAASAVDEVEAGDTDQIVVASVPTARVVVAVIPVLPPAEPLVEPAPAPEPQSTPAVVASSPVQPPEPAPEPVRELEPAFGAPASNVLLQAAAGPDQNESEIASADKEQGRRTSSSGKDNNSGGNSGGGSGGGGGSGAVAISPSSEPTPTPTPGKGSGKQNGNNNGNGGGGGNNNKSHQSSGGNGHSANHGGQHK